MLYGGCHLTLELHLRLLWTMWHSEIQRQNDPQQWSPTLSWQIFTCPWKPSGRNVQLPFVRWGGGGSVLRVRSRDWGVPWLTCCGHSHPPRLPACPFGQNGRKGLAIWELLLLGILAFQINRNSSNGIISFLFISIWNGVFDSGIDKNEIPKWVTTYSSPLGWNKIQMYQIHIVLTNEKKT